MLGNFVYSNPTRLYFGDRSLEYLKEELKNYGERVLLIYGGGSVKRFGIYDEIIKILKECGKLVFEDAGVMPNPTTDKLREGCERARAGKVDFLLAVGGGSVIDYAKAISASALCEGDPWQKYYVEGKPIDNKILPMGCVLTMVGTGSEMNGGSVITDTKTKMKIARVYNDGVYPKFAILNPLYTYTLPEYQMVAGIFDIFSHICEQYFSGDDDNTSDYIMEGLFRSLLVSSRIAKKNPKDYEARSNIMWIATWALNTLVDRGKATDWEVHMLGHAVSAVTDATHGMTLAAISLPYYNHILPYALPKLCRFAVNVFGVNPEGKSDEQIAKEGLCEMEKWMKEMGVVMKLSELGVTEDMIDEIARGVFINQGGYKVLTNEEVKKILRASL